VRGSKMVCIKRADCMRRADLEMAQEGPCCRSDGHLSQAACHISGDGGTSLAAGPSAYHTVCDAVVHHSLQCVRLHSALAQPCTNPPCQPPTCSCAASPRALALSCSTRACSAASSRCSLSQSRASCSAFCRFSVSCSAAHAQQPGEPAAHISDGSICLPRSSPCCCAQ
jgi:hypothetical protein